MEKCLQNLVMQRNSVSRCVVGIIFCVLFSTVGHAAQLQQFEAKYKAFQYGKELGQASLKLESLGRNKFRLSYQSKVSVFFLSDKRKETSLFSFEDDKIIPFKYSYERTGFGSDKSLVAEFDGTSRQIDINKKDKLPWNNELDNQLYRLDIQLQLAQNKKEFSYDLVNNRGQLRHYDLLVLGSEQLTLPYGTLEGIKVKMMRENSTRETFAWFAPQLDYQLVRLQQFKDGDEQGDIQLSSFSQSNSVH